MEPEPPVLLARILSVFSLSPPGKLAELFFLHTLLVFVV